MPEKLQTLESLAFPTQVDREVLQQWFDRNNYIQPDFIERDDIKGNKSYELKLIEWEKYHLKIAKDIKNKELPSIIYRINQLTFWENMPEYASTQELGRKILFVIDTLLEQDIKFKDDKKEISKYIRLYAQLFWKESVKKISNKNERDEILGKNEQNRFNKFKEKIKILEETGNLLEELENDVTQHIKLHLRESVFENKIVNEVKTITKNEIQKLLEKKDSWEIQKDEFKMKDLTIKDFNEEEKILRDTIGIENLKQTLNQARKKWKIRTIEKYEKKAVNRILEELYKFPWQNTSDRYGESVKHIKETKQIQCVGYSNVWHKFLQELWIEHYSITMDKHSALDIIIWWENYYFDATAYRDIRPFYYWDEKGKYKEIVFKGIRENIYTWLYAFSENPEISLQSHLLHNLWIMNFDNWDVDMGIEIYRQALIYNPDSAKTHRVFWDMLSKKWKLLREEWLSKEAEIYENKAIETYKTAIPLDSSPWDTMNYLWDLFTRRWNYSEAMKILEYALKTGNKSSKIFHSIGNVFKEQWKLDKAEKFYKKSINWNSKIPEWYSSLWKLLIKNWLSHSWNLITFAYKVMATEENVSGDFWKEENKIIKLIQKEGYWRLRRFLFSEIKKEKKIQAKEKEKSTE